MSDGTKTSNVTGPNGKLFYLHEGVSAGDGDKTQTPGDSFSLEGGSGKVLTAKGGWGAPPERVARVFREDAAIPTAPPPAVSPVHMILVEAPDFARLVELWKAVSAGHGEGDIASLRKRTARVAFDNELRIISGQFAEWCKQTYGLVSAYEARLNNLVSAGMEQEDGPFGNGPKFASSSTMGKFIEDGGIPFDRLIVLIEAMCLPMETIRNDAISTSHHVLEKFIGAIPCLPDTFASGAERIHTALDEFRFNLPPTKVTNSVLTACTRLSMRFGFPMKLMP